jgi:Trypsin-like peptidase domain
MSPFVSETSQPIDVFAAISPGYQGGGASDVLPYTSMRPTGDESSLAINYQRSVYRAEVVGVDPGKDIAVLKITAPASELHPIQVGTSKGLRVGQLALAIGNPFGLDHTLTGEKMLLLLPTCPDTKMRLFTTWRLILALSFTFTSR